MHPFPGHLVTTRRAGRTGRLATAAAALAALVLVLALGPSPAVAQESDPLSGASAGGFEVPTPQGWQVVQSEPTLHLTRTEPAGAIFAAALPTGDVQDAVLAALRGFVDRSLTRSFLQTPLQQSPANLPSGTWTQRIYALEDDLVALLTLQREGVVYVLVARGTQDAFMQNLNAAVTQMLLGFAVEGGVDATAAEDVAADAAEGFTTQAVALGTPAGTLHGTLLVPTDVPRPPVALIIAGSGPTDRDGNSPLIAGRNDSLKMLAESLARHGVATLRYDKRGIGASAGALSAEEDVRFEDYVADAVGWLQQLAADDRFDGRVVIGHSEGSLIGMLAAEETSAGAFVSLAGPGRSAADLLRVQLAAQLPAQLLEEATNVLASLEEGETVAAVSDELASLFRASVQPYLISWFRYDPAEVVARLPMPVLIVQGTNDVQVAVAEAELLQAADPEADLVLVEDMNHVLKVVAPGQDPLASYGDPTLPLADGLVDAIAGFVEAVLLRR